MHTVNSTFFGIFLHDEPFKIPLCCAGTAVSPVDFRLCVKAGGAARHRWCRRASGCGSRHIAAPNPVLMLRSMKISASKAALSLVALAVVAFISGCASAPKVAPRQPVTESDLFYNGFSYAGAEDKIAGRYPYFSMAFPSAEENSKMLMAPGMNAACRDFLLSRDGVANADGSKTVDLNPWTKVKIGAVAQKNDMPLALSIGLTQEVVLREKFNDDYKVGITLWFNLLVLDFSTKEVVSSKTFYVERVPRPRPRPFSDAEIAEYIREMMTTVLPGEQVTRLRGKLEPALASVYGRGKNISQLQVRTIDTGGHLEQWLPSGLRGNTDLYTELLGQQLTDIFGSTSNVAMLPFTKDKQSTNMTLVFADASRVDFRIPEPSYVIDVKLDGITKNKGKEDAARTIWIFTAKGTGTIIEPHTNGILGSIGAEVAENKYNSIRKIEVDDYPTVLKAIRQLFRTLSLNTNADKKTRINIFDKCRL